jgi:hypothetical protein
MEKKNMFRQATAEEKKVVESSISELKELAKNQVKEYIRQTIVGALLLLTFVLVSSSVMAPWFNICMYALSSFVVGYWVYDAVNRASVSEMAINAIESGDYMIASGETNEYEFMRYDCVVDGVLENQESGNVEFSINNSFAETKDFDRNFIVVYTYAKTYVIATIPNGDVLVTDSVTIN